MKAFTCLQFILWITLTATPPLLNAAAIDPEAQSILSPLLRAAEGKHTSFTTSGCTPIPTQKWLGLLLLGQPVIHQFKFSAGCDVDGELRVLRQPFPVDLKVRHLQTIKRLKGHVEPQVTPNLWEQQIKITARLNRAQLYSETNESLLGFDADYGLVTAMDGTVKRNEGGQVKLRTFRGKQAQGAQRFYIERL